MICAGATHCAWAQYIYPSLLVRVKDICQLTELSQWRQSREWDEDGSDEHMITNTYESRFKSVPQFFGFIHWLMGRGWEGLSECVDGWHLHWTAPAIVFVMVGENRAARVYWEIARVPELSLVWFKVSGPFTYSWSSWIRFVTPLWAWPHAK